MGYKVSLGALPSPIDIRDYRIKAPQAANYPDEFILGDLPDVLNQGSVGSCVAHTIAAIISWHIKKQLGVKIKMSIIGSYGNRRNTTYKGSGMFPRDNLLAMIKDGLEYYTELPGNEEVPLAIDIYEQFTKDSPEIVKNAIAHGFTAVARADDENSIKYALMNHGPVLFVVPWYDDMKYRAGYLDSERRTNASGSHCMMIYGWTTINGKLYWLIQNSWGLAWGNRGRAKMPADIGITEAWDIIDEFVESDNLKKRFTSPVGRVFAKIINAILNWWESVTNKEEKSK